MGTYSYAQLMQLWISQGGPRVLAPVAAAIAEAESGGNSDAYNPSGASGLWQIDGLPFPGNPFDPSTNAKMAVAKWRDAPGGGRNFTPWVTYTSGAYKAYLNNSTTPDPNVPGSGTAQATLTAKQVTELAATAQSDCLWKIGFVNSSGTGPSAWGWIGAAIHDFLNPTSPAAPTGGGEICIFSKSQMRGIAGVALMGAGAIIALPGIALFAAAMGGRVEQAAAPAVSAVSQFTPAGRAVSAGTALAARTTPKAARPAAAARPTTGEVAAQRAKMRQRADQVSTRVEPPAS